MTTEFLQINQKNIHILEKFIKLNTSENFTYYKKRTKEVINNHIVTVILHKEEEIIGYGHLDYEEKVWLGICVLQKYTGQSYGKKIMEFLLKEAKNKKIKQIYLSFYKNNVIAYQLYKKVGFESITTRNDVCYMVKNL